MIKTSTCSTPNGIKGNRTLCKDNTINGVSSAQRLTASKVIAHLAFFVSYSPLLCSTPNGIKGNRTGGRAACIGTLKKCSTPNGIKGNRTKAQHSKTIAFCRAQRLTASKVIAHLHFQKYNFQKIVLNA